MDLSAKNVIKAKADTSGRVYRVYCDGIFDLFHVGHMKMLEQAKKMLGQDRTYLLVGVCSDELTLKYKGKTVMNHSTRCESVKHCKWVDEVVAEAPWVLDEKFLDKYKIDFVAHDAIPYADTSGQAGGDVYQRIKETGRFMETKRTDGISTSDIIVEIVRDYDEYVERNLDRGYTKEQLGVGASWEFRRNAHIKKRKLDGAVENLKSERRELSEAAKAFVRQFKNKKVFDNPGLFFADVKKTLPDTSRGVVAHTKSYCRALCFAGGYLCSFLNPFGYCRTRPKKKAS